MAGAAITKKNSMCSLLLRVKKMGKKSLKIAFEMV
jgi:hypothetical protein